MPQEYQFNIKAFLILGKFQKLLNKTREKTKREFGLVIICFKCFQLEIKLTLRWKALIISNFGPDEQVNISF